MFGLYLTNDLFFASRVTTAARTAGAELRVVGAAEKLLEAIEVDCGLVLLDLDTLRAEASSLVPAIREKAPPGVAVVAFGSHVHEARLEAARQAGCDAVLTRGQFDRQIGDVLRTWLGR